MVRYEVGRTYSKPYTGLEQVSKGSYQYRAIGLPNNPLVTISQQGKVVNIERTFPEGERHTRLERLPYSIDIPEIKEIPGTAMRSGTLNERLGN
jgi:hypothetical protein